MKPLAVTKAPIPYRGAVGLPAPQPDDPFVESCPTSLCFSLRIVGAVALQPRLEIRQTHAAALVVVTARLKSRITLGGAKRHPEMVVIDKVDVVVAVQIAT